MQSLKEMEKDYHGAQGYVFLHRSLLVIVMEGEGGGGVI